MEKDENLKKLASDLKDAVGKRLRALRKAAGYDSAGDLAAKIGVAPTSVYEIEQGQNWISPEMALLLSPVLKVSIPELYGDHPNVIHAEKLVETIEKLSKASPSSVKVVSAMLDEKARAAATQAPPKAAK